MSEFAFTTTTHNDVARFHDTINMTKIDQILGKIEGNKEAQKSLTDRDACRHIWNQMHAETLDLAVELINRMYEMLPAAERKQLIDARVTALTYMAGMATSLNEDLAVGYTIPPKM